MRLVPALALAVFLTSAIASPALAQTQYADSSGGFVVLHGLAFGTSSYTRFIDASVGYRFTSGLDASLRVASRGSLGSTTALGPTVGITRPLGAGFMARVEGSVLASQSSGYVHFSADGSTSELPVRVQHRALRTDVTATVMHSVRLLGSLRMHPTLGLYVRTGTERVTFDGTPADRDAPFDEARAGMHVALPLSFRLFGQTASVEAAMRFSPHHGFSFEVPGDATFSPGGGAYAGGGLRLNF